MIRKKDKWDELQERWVVGEPLTSSEETTRRVLASRDQRAQRELDLYDELRRQLASSSDEEAPREFVGRVLEAAGLRAATHLRLVAPGEQPPQPAPAEKPRRRLPRAGLVAGAAVTLAAAAAAFVVLSSHGDPTESRQARTPKPPSPITPVPQEAARSELVFASGTVTVNGKAVEPGHKTLTGGEHLATGSGRACFTIDPGIDVCLAENSEVVVDSLAERDLVVEVTRGEAVAALKPREPGHEFSLTAKGVSATARGTVFGVSLDNAGAARVTVVEGKVEVVDTRRQRALVRAHSRLDVARSKPLRKEQIGRTEEGQMLALLGPRELWQERELGVLALEGAPGTKVMIDDEGPFELPVSSFVAPGKHRVAVRRAGKERTVEVEVVAGKVNELSLNVASPRALSTQRESVSVSSETTAGELLAKAREALKRGDTTTALNAYRDLRRTYPKSPEAATVLVTVGKLELRQNAPGRALNAFDSYLQRGGPLRPEALAGRIRALRALGRTADERRAIESYLASYPKGFEAISLKKRLETLSSR